MSKGDAIIRNVSLKRLRGKCGGPIGFTAIGERLGLRLEVRKMPLEVPVVDRANKTPTEN